MPVLASPRQPELAARAWFSTPAGMALLEAEAGLPGLLAAERPGQLQLWLRPTIGAGTGGPEPPVSPRLRLWAAADGVLGGDLRCATPLPLASESCGVILLQHLGDLPEAPPGLLEECARVLVAGGRLWLLALNPLSPYRWRWRGQGLKPAEPVTWRRRLRAAGLEPEPGTQGMGPVWSPDHDSGMQVGAGLRAAFLLRAEKRRIPLTPVRRRVAVRLQPGVSAP